ncbi:hypothetical protein FRC02_004092 [Tulasnella sp. 418]|nr:hypothetical protein FRC02_004092 [Tulasnella sp. 418]
MASESALLPEPNLTRNSARREAESYGCTMAKLAMPTSATVFVVAIFMPSGQSRWRDVAIGTSFSSMIASIASLYLAQWTAERLHETPTEERTQGWFVQRLPRMERIRNLAQHTSVVLLIFSGIAMWAGNCR